MDQRFSEELVNAPPVLSRLNVEDEVAFRRWDDDGGFCLHPRDQADGFYNDHVAEAGL